MGKQRGIIAFILVLIIGAIYVLKALPLKLGLDLQGGAQLTLLIKTTPEVPRIGEREMEAVIEVITNRVNAFGVSESVVQSAGADQILVQLPGVSDTAQAERVLQGAAVLEFREQLPNTESQFDVEQRVRAGLVLKQEELEKSGDTAGLEENKAALERSSEAIAALFSPAALTGRNLKDAGAQPTGPNTWEIYIRFDGEGADRFAELTKNLAGTGRSIGIFLDNELISAPIVGVQFAQTGIVGGSASITGNFDAQGANDLAIKLRGGALPVPVEVVENRTVGATLGQDSIRRSIAAGIGGLILVLIFMVAYYRLPGLIADISLIIYAILTLAVFSLFEVTLTLPGIAGFILSIGMAVDANVLIFERTREELLSGKSLYRSVESGFYRAFSSILDGNVTTVIACAGLFWFGSGLVKGFALTLAIGVVVSMFTAITCSRTILFTAIALPALRKPELFLSAALLAKRVERV
jgi:preprotein translocase subunit SecD